MAHYSLSDHHVLTMPIKRFWLLSESIDRMKSADDLRSIRVAASVLGDESYKTSTAALTDAVGQVAVTIHEELDEVGLSRFKQKMMMG